MSESGSANLRSEVRDFLSIELAQGAFEPHCDAWMRGHDPAFSRRLGARGWIGMTWPARYGGHERPVSDRQAVVEELLASGAPVAAHWFADRQTGPLLLRYGTEYLRSRFMPAIARGECFFSVGISEADAGSDVASIRTSATKDVGGWRLNGTKLWTSHAALNDYAVVLCRTGAATGARHDGFTQLIVDLKQTGVEIHPILLLDGEPDFNEVVFNDHFVPDELVIGEAGNGWAQVMSELAIERGGPERFLSVMPLLHLVVDHVGRRPGELDAESLGRLFARLSSLRNLSVRVAADLSRETGGDHGARAALVKDLGTRFEQEMTDALRLIVRAGGAGAPEDRLERLLDEAVLGSPGFTLRGGASEVLRGVIGRDLVAHERR